MNNNLTLLFLIASILLAGCAGLPKSGPSNKAIEEYNQQKDVSSKIQIIDVNQKVVTQLLKKDPKIKFSETLGSSNTRYQTVGMGDLIEISIWEAPPATLFSASSMSASTVASSSGSVVLPEQMINNEGMINVPFAGQISAHGKSLYEIESEIIKRLKGKANQAQVIARVVRNASSNVTVIGDVANTIRMPLTANGEKLLDAIAAAGGPKQPASKTTVQVTRGINVYALPLEAILKDSSENVQLMPGDLVTVSFQPKSFTALGATNKNEEVNFETQGISLAQALARIGGLNDSRADAQGVFIFRFENKDSIDWPAEPKELTADGKVAVIYRIDLKNPANFFNVQNFKIENKDVLYVSNAPITELQKFLNVLFSITFPFLNATTVLQAK
jgi:polysaccharide export outer membrane protein